MQPKIKGVFPRVIDSTMRADFMSCETKGYYSFNRKLGPPEGSVHLVAGGAYAKGLEVARLAIYGEKLPVHEGLERGMLAAIEAYGDFQTPEGKEQKGVDRVIQAMASYFEHYPPGTDHVQPMFASDGKPMVEFTFGIPIPVLHPDSGEPIIYAGRFDMVGLYNDQVFCVDDKTTTQLGPTWPAKWNLRGQFTGYAWACQQYGKPVVGAIVRGTSFLKNSFGHAEAIQMRPQWMIDQWYEQLIHDVTRWIRAWESGWFDQDFNETCAEYGGCPFQRLCTSSDPENWIEGYYKERDWDPLAKVPYVQPKQKVVQVEVPEGLRAIL